MRCLSSPGCVAALGGLLLLASSGCAVVPPGDVYMRLQVRNKTDLARPQEIVEIPISKVREKLPDFDPDNFSVHLLPTRLYTGSDPMMATDPPPEIAAQMTDRDLDGQMDTLLVSMDFSAQESRYIAVASPRYSSLLPAPESMVSGGLWRRESMRDDGTSLHGEGPFTQADTFVMPRRHEPGDGLFFLDGVLFENDVTGYRLMFDRRLSLDVMAKQSGGMVLDPAVPGEFPSLVGEPDSFGAGALGIIDGDTIRPLQGFNSVQYRMISNGPVATEAEILINGCAMNGEAFDIKWHLTLFAGNSYLRHDVSVSRTGHRLGFGVGDHGGARQRWSSSKSGWMRSISFGSENSMAGGAAGVGLMNRGLQCTGHTLSPPNITGIKFEPMLKDFTFYTLSTWDMGPNGVSSLAEFNKLIDELAGRVNEPILVLSKDFVVS